MSNPTARKIIATVAAANGWTGSSTGSTFKRGSMRVSVYYTATGAVKHAVLYRADREVGVPFDGIVGAGDAGKRETVLGWLTAEVAETAAREAAPTTALEQEQARLADAAEDFWSACVASGPAELPAHELDGAGTYTHAEFARAMDDHQGANIHPSYRAAAFGTDAPAPVDRWATAQAGLATWAAERDTYGEGWTVSAYGLGQHDEPALRYLTN
jgi:hypothetical protein